MKKLLLLQIFLFLFSLNPSSAQDIASEDATFLSKEMRKLKSEYNVFLDKKVNKEGGIFLNQIIIALENSVITEGIKIDQLNEVFSGKIIIPEITRDHRVVKDVGLLPLDGSYWDERKLPGVPGPSWFLVFSINKKSEVHRLSLRYMTVKDVYMNWYE